MSFPLYFSSRRPIFSPSNAFALLVITIVLSRTNDLPLNLSKAIPTKIPKTLITRGKNLKIKFHFF